MRKTIHILVDDIDGSDAVETVYFSVGDHYYEIDLAQHHLDQFHDQMDNWVKYARRVQPGAVKGAPSLPNDASLIRAWAKEKGLEIARRGRIPAAVRQQYYAETVTSSTVK